MTVLGTGLVGAGMARSLLAAGLDVTVWNRSLEKARPLADDGARVADSAAARAWCPATTRRRSSSTASSRTTELSLAAARAADVDTTVLEAADGRLRAASDAGYGAQDLAAVVEVDAASARG